MVAAFVDSCVRCSLEKGGSNFQKKRMKPVPLPEDMFTTIVMDEMVRNVKGESVKFLVAMEGLSQFVTCIIYEGAMTGPKFLAMIGSCKSILCPHGLKNAKIELRVDAAPWHTSAVVRECLAFLNVELRIHQSTTLSKNILPELDNKMRRIGEYISLFMESEPVSLQLAVHLAAAKCNSTIGFSGYSPAEIFTGRGWRSNELIQIEVRKLLEQIIKRRESQRLMKERERARKFMKKELQLVPYEDPSLNSPLVANQMLVKIRVGDWVTLKSQASDDKNEIPSPWVVMGISFPKKVLQLKKTSGAESGQGEAKWIAFELVDKVFPKQDRICHIQLETELEEFEDNDADRIWLQGKRDVSGMVVSALVATHELWACPDEIEEVLVPDLQFSRSIDMDSKSEPNLSCNAKDLPKRVHITPNKKEEEWKEEFVTPEEFSTPMAMDSVSKKEEKKVFKTDDSPPKLQLDQSLEDEKLPSPKSKKKDARKLHYQRRSTRVSKPVQKFQAGQK